MLSNAQIANILKEISEYLEMEDDPFRPRAYQKAARVIELQNRSLASIYNREGIKGLEGIPGIGEMIAKKIEELILTGQLQYFEKLKKESPVDVSTLTKIEGMGPKKIKALWQKLGVRNLDDLKKVVSQHKIRELDGFGEKSEENISKGIEALKAQKERLALKKVLPIAEKIKRRLNKLPEVKKVEIAGSIRRKKETVGDIDMLVLSDKPEKVMDVFVGLPQIVEIYAKGQTKSSGRLSIGIDIDLRIVPEKSFGATLQYFTGSKLHNIKLRTIALKKGYKLNEYGLFRNNEQIAGKNEKDIYEKLGTRYIEPEKRIGENEIVITDTKIKEKSVGAVVFYRAHNLECKTKEKIEYLILHYPPRHPDPTRARGQKTSKHGHWDYVKGHIDEKENELATLKREIKEEIGLSEENYKIVPGFKKLLRYNFRTERGLHFKEVVFYLVESKTKDVKLSYEHDDYRWVIYEKALETVTFRGGKEILIRANKYLINIEKL
jgi:DNA polymerase/3'-5' exonuclease PolX/8-oxo-dGTP pyrophosphatase MutT (NUDIX family)